MLRHRLSVCVSVGRQESKSFGDRVRQHRPGGPGLEAGKNFFLLPNLPGKHKTDRLTEEKSVLLCHAAEIFRPASRGHPVVAPDAARRFPAREGD